MILWTSILYGFCGFGLVFSTCEIGQRFTKAFDEIDREIEQLDWYLFPIEIQRILPTIIINAQEPIVIECFGIISCNRDQFKKVSLNR